MARGAGDHDVMTENGAPQLSTPGFGKRGRNHVVRRKHVRMVFADSNELDIGWRSRALRTKSANRWTIVIMHHPVYSAGHHFRLPGSASACAGCSRSGALTLCSRATTTPTREPAIEWHPLRRNGRGRRRDPRLDFQILRQVLPQPNSFPLRHGWSPEESEFGPSTRMARSSHAFERAAFPKVRSGRGTTRPELSCPSFIAGKLVAK
jgi:hypothetical protein